MLFQTHHHATEGKCLPSDTFQTVNVLKSTYLLASRRASWLNCWSLKSSCTAIITACLHSRQSSNAVRARSHFPALARIRLASWQRPFCNRSSPYADDKSCITNKYNLQPLKLLTQHDYYSNTKGKITHITLNQSINQSATSRVRIWGVLWQWLFITLLASDVERFSFQVIVNTRPRRP